MCLETWWISHSGAFLGLHLGSVAERSDAPRCQGIPQVALAYNAVNSVTRYMMVKTSVHKTQNSSGKDTM